MGEDTVVRRKLADQSPEGRKSLRKDQLPVTSDVISMWSRSDRPGIEGGGLPGVIHVTFYGVCSPPVKCTTRGVLGVTQSVLMSQHMCVPPTARLTRMSVSFVLITGKFQIQHHYFSSVFCHRNFQ